MGLYRLDSIVFVLLSFGGLLIRCFMQLNIVSFSFFFLAWLYSSLSFGSDSEFIIGQGSTHLSYPLDSIKAVKWKQKLPARGGKYHDMVYGLLSRPLRADGAPVSFDRIARELSNIGVQSVAFRIDSLDRYIDINGNGSYDEMDNYHKELVLAIRALEKQNIDAYLFARIWLNKHSNDYVVRRFGLYLNNLNVEDLSNIDGVALTEVHLNDMDELKRRAIGIARKTNSRYDNWLKTRGFIMPGLDNGFRFTGIDKVDDFHDVISSEVGQFSFSIKYMKLNRRHDLNGLYEYFSKINSDSYFSYQTALETYVRYGLNDLYSYQSNAASSRVGSVVFWGDSGDSLFNTRPKSVQFFRQFLQEQGVGITGAFLYQVTTDSDISLDDYYDRQVVKSLLLYDKDTDLFSINNMEYGLWKGVLGTYKQWDYWFKTEFDYFP